MADDSLSELQSYAMERDLITKLDERYHNQVLETPIVLLRAAEFFVTKDLYEEAQSAFQQAVNRLRSSTVFQDSWLVDLAVAADVNIRAILLLGFAAAVLKTGRNPTTAAYDISGVIQKIRDKAIGVNSEIAFHEPYLPSWSTVTEFVIPLIDNMIEELSEFDGIDTVAFAKIKAFALAGFAELCSESGLDRKGFRAAQTGCDLLRRALPLSFSQLPTYVRLSKIYFQQSYE